MSHFGFAFRTDPRARALLEQHRNLGWSCSGPGCETLPSHLASYHYGTGRAGRVTERTLYLCARHAAAFAGAHGLTPPEKP